MLTKAGKTPHPKSGQSGVRTLGGLARLGTAAKQAEHSLDIFLRWGIRKEDLNARAVKTLLERTWRGWAPARKRLFLLAAERIAEAEKVKLAWNPKVNSTHHKRLSKAAIAAAQLAQEIATFFPPPWEGSRKPIGDLVTQLAAFISGTLAATAPLDKQVSFLVARELIRGLKEETPRATGRIHWELIKDLAWHASGKQLTCSERTVRRYLEEPPLSKSPGHTYWERNWEVIRSVSRLAPHRQPGAFKDAAKDYLKTPSS